MNARRLLIGAVFAAVAVFSIDALADATQNRPDAIVSGTRSTVVFSVETRDDPGGDPAAALTLWRVCAATVSHVEVLEGPREVRDGWAVTVEPALGEHSRRRLVGCLEDATLDGVRGEVVDLTPHPR
jgi:hypothetical protein